MRLRWLFLVLFILTFTPALATDRRPIGAPDVTVYSRTLLEQINNYRHVHGLNALMFDSGLIQLARTHSFEMFQQHRISHLNFKKRFERSGSHFCVENVGWNYTTALKQFDAWRQSSGHDQNMLTEPIRKAGIAEVGGYVTFIGCQ